MNTLFNTIESKLKTYRPFAALRKCFVDGDFPVTVHGPRGPFLARLVAKLSSYDRGATIVLVPTEKEARAMAGDIGPEARVFPGWDVTPYHGDDVPASNRGERLRILADLFRGNAGIIVVPVRTVMQPVPKRERLAALGKTVSVGHEIDPVELEGILADYGYLRVPRVSVHGEFALRGEVLDVFPPGFDEPVRVVFDFDSVEQIRVFDPFSQASSGSLESLTIMPQSEFLWSSDDLAALEEYFGDHAGDGAAEILELLRETGTCPEEHLYFAQVAQGASLLSYLPERCTLYVVDAERCRAQEDSILKEYRELFKKARPGHPFLPKPSAIVEELDPSIEAVRRRIELPTIRDADSDGITLAYQEPRSFFGNVKYLKEEVATLKESGYDITVVAEGENQALRLRTLLDGVTVESGHISSGFALPDLGIMVIHEREIFGRRKRPPASVKRVKSEAIDAFVDLEPGDFVVHVNYGIGLFKGIERITAAGTERDYINLEYAGEETVFIPIEQVNLVQRYIGQEGRPPRLDKIGGKAWENRKSRVRKSVEDLADHLLRIYSRRRKARGFSFSRDSDWQLEFEANFPFEETEDQLKCIDEVKADMEGHEPMDRLICGDVGYGKTEVAMRAVFKAVADGKQVAFLAPTTILAEQHFETFQERFEGFPVSVEMVSRFVPKASIKKTLERAIDGQVDVLIGTHRILQKDVKFKNLGLIVVDEEQRFGVKDKERLKDMKASVDCLSMSATPIPRTLHMSLLKIRDLSMLTTAPHNRRPIETFIREFDDEIVARAIRSEIERDGQVFFLHNRVETLENTAGFLRALVPEVMIETAHGQMHSTELEDIMHRFIHGAFQVLVATTIIENGINIPNVNTIVIDRADMYGISQLYQLRGRVGRSDRKAYAYLLYPEQRALSEIAMKRLRVISDYTELGSGFKIAMKDMEIRGAGNLLGREQHGDILSVGFDMYMRLLDEAVAELDGAREEGPGEVYLELDYTGYIPDEYISDPSEKMEVYKKISSVQTEEELAAVQGEVEDRFGPLPDEVLSLLSLAEIRTICKRLWIQSLKERKGTVTVEFSKVSIISVDKVLRLISESGGNVRLDPHRPQVLVMDTGVVGLKEKSEFIRERLSMLL